MIGESLMFKYISLLPLAILILMVLLQRFEFVSEIISNIFDAIIYLFFCVYLLLGPFVKIIPVFGDSWYWIIIYELLGIFSLYLAIEHLCVAIYNYKQIKNKN